MSTNGYELKHNVDLKPLTTIKIGGKAKDFIVIYGIGGLKKFLGQAADKPYYLLGNGSNLLVSDDEITTPVICLDQPIEMEKTGKQAVFIFQIAPVNTIRMTGILLKPILN